MENLKAGTNEDKSTINSNEENPNDNNTINSSAATTVLAEGGGGELNAAAAVAGNENEDSRQTRTPFTNLSQVDADLALARTLQEQERAFMMIRMNGDGSDYGSWEAGSYVPEDDDDDFDDLNEDEYDDSDADDDHEHDQDDDDDEEDAFDVHAHSDDGNDDDDPGVELDHVDFPSDEAYARALQDAEDREMAARLLALSGINEREAEEAEDHGGNSQDTWEDVDPDELSYEELLALGDVVGTENRGLSTDSIASLPSMSYKMQSNQDGNSESCVICRLDYEDGDTLTVLSCKHSYHSECINNWLKINKVCPVCSAEVSTSGSS